MHVSVIVIDETSFKKVYRNKLEKGFHENEKSLLIFTKVNNFNRLKMASSTTYWTVGHKSKNSRHT